MLGIKIGQISKILKNNKNTTEILVNINGNEYRAINYVRLTGVVEVGDTLLLNTTAMDLNLGTGGFHFVISNLDKPNHDFPDDGGHIMKLRYSPYQLKVFAAEEQDSEYHDVFNGFQSLREMPVVVGTLHSMLLPMVEILKYHQKDIKIAYIMTDGAALPIDLSNTVLGLRNTEKISSTITIGNAFGGDFDCVNIYNGLIAAKDIVKADVAIVTMGPGIVGTGTKFGFSGIEQGHIIDAVNDLGGIPIAIPRISFSDQRERHRGLSHHSITILDKIIKTRAIVGMPILEGEKRQYIQDQLNKTGIANKHQLRYVNPHNMMEVLKQSNLKMSTMGRGLLEEKEYFSTVAIGAKLAIEILNDRQ